MTKAKKSYFFDERICPVCGKAFHPAPYHVYKVYVKNSQKEFACSYSCVIRAEREREEKRRLRTSEKPV